MYITVRYFFFFFQAEDGIRDLTVTGVQTCALPILHEGRGLLDPDDGVHERREGLQMGDGEILAGPLGLDPVERVGGNGGSGEGRVGEEGRSRWVADYLKKKKK